MASLGISRASSHRQKSLKFAKKLSPSSSATGSKGGNGASLTSSSSSGLFDEHGLFVMKGMCDSGKLANLLFGLAFSVVLLLLFASLGKKVGVGSVGCVLSHSRARGLCRMSCRRTIYLSKILLRCTEYINTR